MEFQFTESFIKNQIKKLTDALDYTDLDSMHSSVFELANKILEAFPPMSSEGKDFLLYDKSDGLWKKVFMEDSKLFKILMTSFDKVFKKKIKGLDSEIELEHEEFKNSLGDNKKQNQHKHNLNRMHKLLKQVSNLRSGVVCNKYCIDMSKTLYSLCSSINCYETNEKKNKHRIISNDKTLIDLQSGECFSVVSKTCAMTRIPYDFLGFDEECQNANNFLLQLCNNDKLRCEGLKSVLGYCITNLNNAKKLFVFYGKEGDNGKSVLLQVMKGLLGIKTQPVTQDLLISSNKTSSNGNPELLTLRNVTLGVLSELQDNQRLNETTFKTITGGDEMSARALFSNKMCTFTLPTKIITHSNKPAYVDTSDKASKNRLHITYFDAVFCDNPTKPNEFKKISKFAETFLKEHGDEFFTLCVQYAKKYVDEGLIENESTKSDKERYIEMIDPIHQFVDSTFEECDNGIEYFNDIWGDFKNYCLERNVPYHQINKRKPALIKCLAAKYKKIKKNNKFRRGDNTAFKGLRNVNNEEEDAGTFGFDEIEDDTVNMMANVKRVNQQFYIDQKGFTSNKELKEIFDDIPDTINFLRSMGIPEVKRKDRGFRLTKHEVEEPAKEPAKEEEKEPKLELEVEPEPKPENVKCKKLEKELKTLTKNVINKTSKKKAVEEFAFDNIDDFEA